MNRLEFITLLGAAGAAWPDGTQAQQGERVRRVGILVGSAEHDINIQAWLAELQDGLEAFGWKEGRNISFERRYAAGDTVRAEAHAKALVQLNPDIIVTSSTPAATALRRETRTIPIVFTNLSDPVGSGVVSNLAQPGENTTGFTNFEYSIAGKWLEILRDLSPKIRRTGLFFNPVAASYSRGYIQSFEAAASYTGVQPMTTPLNNPAEIEQAVAEQAREPGGSIVVLPDIFMVTNRQSIIASSAYHRVPAVYPYRVMAADGGLAVYGPDIGALYRRAAGYVHRILKGEKAGDLPVQQPTKFEFVINASTARALGITVPPTLLARADEVIE